MKRTKMEDGKSRLVGLALMLLAALAAAVQGDGWDASKASHQTLYANTLTSKTEGSDIIVADDFGVTGDMWGLGNLDLSGSLNLSGNLYAAGSLGVGTTSPAVELTINDASQAELQLTTDALGSASTDGLIIGVNGADAFINMRENQALRFFTNNQEYMRILPTGEVGIGTSSPSKKLEIKTGANSLLFDPSDATRMISTTNNQDLSMGSDSGNIVMQLG